MPEMALELVDALRPDPALALVLRVAFGLLMAGAAAVLVACSGFVLAHCCGPSRFVRKVQ
jgi:hypothetical protein